MKKTSRLASVLAFALVCALPSAAWASSAELLAANLEDGSESFSVAGWNTEQDGKTNLSNSMTITLDEGAQSQADAGTLTYSMSVWGSCDECRTMELTGSVVFRDDSGKELARWADSYEEYDTWRQQHSLSGTGKVPAGTVSIEASVENDTGTKTDLELTGTLTIATTNVDSINGNHATYNVASLDGTGTFPFGNGTATYLMSRTLDATENGTADLRSSMTIFFGEDARSSISKGIALYGLYADFTDLVGGHVLDAYLDIHFYDKNGQEIETWFTSSFHGSDLGGGYGGENSKVELYAEEEAGIEPHIYTKTSYVKIEGRATVGTLSDLASHMTFNFRHEESYLLEALGPSEPSAEGASDEAYAPGSESSMSDAHEGIAQAEEEARAAEEQAEAEESAVADTSLFTPALRLSTAYTLLQTNYADEIAVIDPYEIVSEQTVLTTLYVAKCIATGATESSLRETGIEQLRIEALAWAESAGLDDLYESGVDTYAETIGVIRTYLGMF